MPVTAPPAGPLRPDPPPPGASKEALRAWVWTTLEATGQAAFPRPVRGRIPNFVGRSQAAARLRALDAYRRARVLKVNPDAPQHPVRAMAVAEGKAVLVPTPRLRGGFWMIRPDAVPPGAERRATSLAGLADYARQVPLDRLPRVDLVVTGAVAVSPDGARAGKGDGYSDLEYAILRRLGHPEVPVVTTVHDLQVVPAVPWEPHDLSVDVICTPTRTLVTGTTYPKPDRVDWGRLTAEDLRAMPVLAELRTLDAG